MSATLPVLAAGGELFEAIQPVLAVLGLIVFTDMMWRGQGEFPSVASLWGIGFFAAVSTLGWIAWRAVEIVAAAWVLIFVGPKVLALILGSLKWLAERLSRSQRGGSA